MTQNLAQESQALKEVGVFVKDEEYIIELSENKLVAKKAIYPVKDPEGRLYGNKYEYKYVINFYSPAWAKLEAYQFNKGWSPGIGGMWDSILLFRKAVRKGEVRELVNEIKNKLDTLKDGDLEIKTLVEKVEEFFNKKIAEYVDP